MSNAPIIDIAGWVEKLAREALCIAKERGVTHTDAVDLVAKYLHLNNKIIILKKATDLFIEEKIEAANLYKRKIP